MMDFALLPSTASGSRYITLADSMRPFRDPGGPTRPRGEFYLENMGPCSGAGYRRLRAGGVGWNGC